MLSLTNIARADDLDATPEPVTLAPAASQALTVTLVEADDPHWKGDDQAAMRCNLRNQQNKQGHFLDASVTSSDTNVATVSPASLRFTACGVGQTVTITAVACGTATVTIQATASRSAALTGKPSSTTTRLQLP